MSKMVGRLARAMYDSNGFVRGWDHPKTSSLWHNHYLVRARAAIEAMREPTEAMAYNGLQAHLAEDGRRELTIEAIWAAMIDCALEGNDTETER